MNDMTIGMIGGMGTYATIYAFKQYAELFCAEKEWDRPRIIIDNRCTMPSRVRAVLYNEKREELVYELSESLSHLINTGCDKIILACNTSHIFLPEVYKLNPKLQEKDIIVNIIDECVNAILNDRIKEVSVIASEGTIKTKIYNEKLINMGVNCSIPCKEEFELIRYCIESVKKNMITSETENIFLKLINKSDNCILGCTELPILYERYKEKVTCKRIYDPINIAFRKIKKEFEK